MVHVYSRKFSEINLTRFHWKSDRAEMIVPTSVVGYD